MVIFFLFSKPITLLSDAQAIIRMIIRRTKADVNLKGLLHDIWYLAGCMESVEFVFSNCKINKATHVVVAFIQST